MKRNVLLPLAFVACLLFALAGCGSSSRHPAPNRHPVLTARSPRLASLGPFKTFQAPTVGEVLTTTNGTWTNSPTSYAYQWQDCNSAGGGCVNIGGATSSSYTVASGDVGDTIRCVVTASNAYGSASQASAATGVVIAGTFPLQVSGNGRYLETAAGSPWLLAGDSPQAVMNLTCGTITGGQCASGSPVARYFADRAAYGIDAIWINLLCAAYTGCNSDGTTQDGVKPFTTGSDTGNDAGGYDLSTHNSTYFTRAHAIVATAQADGIAIFLNPIETGGWLGVLQKNGDGASNQSGNCTSTGSKDYCYGVYLGNTFGDLNNIVWLSGNDFEGSSLPPNSDDYDARAVARGIKSTDSAALQTAEFNYVTSSSLDDTNWSSDINLNFNYTYHPTYDQVLHGYNQTPTIPTFMGESNYETQSFQFDTTTPYVLRLTEWWTMTSGATGQLFGTVPCGFSQSSGGGGLGIVDSVITPTTSACDTTGTTQFQYETNLLNTLAWQNLVPDTGHTFLYCTSSGTSCGTDANNTGSEASNNYVTDAKTSDGTLGLAYLPKGGTVTVNLAAMAGPITARWFDPTAGTFTTIGGSPFANSGTHNFTAPAAHSDGNDDWVLLLQDPGNFYVSQSGTGAEDGLSCATAAPVSTLSSSTVWAAGETIHLCGTITSTITAQASGSSGNPITVKWETGAKVSQAVCGPCVSLSNRSYITLDGGTNGIVESTANGTNLANHSGASGIDATPCNNCTVENLTIQNMYVIASGDTHICSSGCAVDNAGVRCINMSGSNWLITHNTMHDASWCLYGSSSGSNTRISYNDIYNMDHGWVIDGGGTITNLYFDHNHVHDMGAWDACNSGNPCHHDGIHCFSIPGPAHLPSTYIYDNTFDGTLGSAATAWIFLEGNSGSSCADSTSHIYVFNNSFSSSDQVSTNPYLALGGSVPAPASAYNNTFSGPGQGHFGANGASCSDTQVDFENNVVGGCNGFNGAGSGTTDFNAYADSTGATNCWPSVGCNFASWQGAGHDAHSVYNASGATGSNATGVGTNLTSLCTGDLVPLCSTIDGTARPAVGAWNAGAS